MSLIAKGDIPKYSAIPPHTPNNTFSLDDFVNRLIADLLKDI